MWGFDSVSVCFNAAYFYTTSIPEFIIPLRHEITVIPAILRGKCKRSLVYIQVSSHEGLHADLQHHQFAGPHSWTAALKLTVI